MYVDKTLTIIISLFSYLNLSCCNGQRVGEINITAYREKAKEMFYHAYNGYLNYAYPYDELQPLTCKGHDTWGSYSLTLIDAMDTLVVMGNHSEFRRIAQILIDKGEGFFDTDINASVFETNIRIVGGLLSAHLLMSRAEMVLEPAWPCSGPLLRMAENIARKILPAFDTPTGMPYGTVNLRHGVPKGETTVTCTAGVGTFLLEFGALSRLTGDPIFEKTAVRAIRALWKFRSPLGLLGNHIDVSTGKWTALDSGIGGGVDSYFEYLVKGAVMFNVPEFLHMFREYEASIKLHLKRDDWYMWAHMTKGTLSLPLFTSLDGYWPSIQSMLGDIDEAMKTLHNFHQVWRQFGFTPEYYNIPNAKVHQGREGYPLRPEIIESAMYLYRATKDPYLLEIGVDILEGIENGARTSCGYATVKDVQDHRLEDRMESFFLAETAKYLYLLFDTDNFLHENGSRGEIRHTPNGVCILGAGGYIFNTEAHPLDLAAVHCCSAEKREEDRVLQEMADNIDLLDLLGITDGDEGQDDEDEGFWEAFKDKDDLVHKFNKKALNKEKEKYLHEQAGEGSCMKEGRKDCGDDKANPDLDNNFDNGEEDDFFDDDDDDFDDLGVDEDEREEEKLKSSKGSHPLRDQHDEKQRSHHQHLHLVDMTKFTEMERNFTRAFMEKQQLTSLLKNVSAEFAREMRISFRETEHEHLANNVARKLDAAQEQDTDSASVTNTSLTSTETDKTAVVKDSEALPAKRSDNILDGADGDAIRDIHEGDNRESKTKGTEASLQQEGPQTILVRISTDPKKDTDKTGAEPATSSNIPAAASKSEEAENTEAMGRFKQHIQNQLQKEDKQPETSSAELTDQLSLKSPSPLEKRTNLLSLTAKLLELFSSTSSNEEGESPSKSSPSLAGLYAALSNYSLNYFNDPWGMHCPSLPFHQRLSIYGEMFTDEP